MDSKDLMSLISEDVKELSLLCSGMTEMVSVPVSVLSLAKGKASSLLQRIEMLESCQKEEASSRKSDVSAPSERPMGVTEQKQPEVSAAFKEKRDEPLASPVVEATPSRECAKAEAKQKKCLDVVESVEYQSEEPAPSKKESAPEKINLETQKGKREVVSRPEVKVNAHESGSVRTVLDANRSSKRVESRFVQSIKKAITLNDRIRYLNELFGGDANLMNSTIAALDAMSSLQEAEDYVKWNFSWDEAEDAVSDFMRLLEDRFS